MAACLPHELKPIAGWELLRHPLFYKHNGYTKEEQNKLGLRGLVPPEPLDMDTQAARCLMQLRSKTSPLEKYIYLSDLQERDEHLYFKVVIENIKEIMPLVYTPTVGAACQNFSDIFRQPRGLYISYKDKGHVREILDRWHQPDVRAIVFTDGERILGLGDQGVDGMGIPIGKLALYVACAGVPPQMCLPITLDVGTNSTKKLENPYYMGSKTPRVRGPEFDEFVEEFMSAAVDKWGRNVLLQFEDFGNLNAFRLLENTRERYCTFNDDIQGTAAVCLGGVLAALPLTAHHKISEHTFVFLGCGEAGVGIADLIASCMSEENGKPVEESRKQIYMLDSRGLVCKERTGLQEHKLHYAHDVPFVKELIDVVKTIKPTCLIGVSATPSTFTEEIIKEMAKNNARPVIMALSNPTSKAECTAEAAYKHTEGRAIFASGSPFDPVEIDGKMHVPGQGNNAYIFPGLSLGVLACKITKLPDNMFLVAARALAKQVTEADRACGCVYPPLPTIREVSCKIAAEVCEEGYRTGVCMLKRPEDILAHCRDFQYFPKHPVW